MYTETILEIFKNPVNAGGLQGANGVGKYVDESCGDIIKFYLKIDENNIISEARFKAIGGVCTIVAGSAMCSCLLDCTIDEALNINTERIYNVTGAFPAEKEYAINLAINAVKNAIDNYKVNLEKQAKKNIANEKITQKIANKEKPEITPEIKERRNVSSAKAAFDALFDL